MAGNHGSVVMVMLCALEQSSFVIDQSEGDLLELAEKAKKYGKVCIVLIVSLCHV